MSSSDPAPRIIVFDGHCHLCSGWVRFMRHRLVTPPFEFVPMQSERGRALLGAHGIDAGDPSTFLVIDGGRAMVQSEAALHVVTTVGGLWRAANIARLLPRAWRDAAYRLLARNRYRWFGRRDVCYMPD